MPGAPDTSTRLPFTMPPPRTRSSSLMPVENRASWVMLMSLRGTGVLPFPVQPGIAALLRAGALSSRRSISSMVFQLPQEGHFPNHFGES